MVVLDGADENDGVVVDDQAVVGDESRIGIRIRFRLWRRHRFRIGVGVGRTRSDENQQWYQVEQLHFESGVQLFTFKIVLKVFDLVLSETLHDRLRLDSIDAKIFSVTILTPFILMIEVRRRGNAQPVADANAVAIAVAIAVADVRIVGGKV